MTEQEQNAGGRRSISKTSGKKQEQPGRTIHMTLQHLHADRIWNNFHHSPCLEDDFILLVRYQAGCGDASLLFRGTGPRRCRVPRAGEGHRFYVPCMELINFCYFVVCMCACVLTSVQLINRCYWVLSAVTNFTAPSNFFGNRKVKIYSIGLI